MGIDEAGTIAIVTDSSADVPAVEREAVAGVPWVSVPELWRGDRDTELADDDLGGPRLITRVLEGEPQPEPSEPGWDDFVAAYTRLREIDRVFSIHSPSTATWSVEHAREAAGASPNVRVIEASVTGIGLGLLAPRARDLAAAGATPDAVEAFLRTNRNSVRMLVVPDRFDPTASQRRLTTGLLAGQAMLHAGPAGSMDRSRRLRSRRATVTAIERYFLEHTSEEGQLHLALGHGGAAGAVDPFLDLLERMRPAAEIVLVGRVGPRLVQQVGTRCVAAAWLQESEPPAS
jgi:fatty acid-binding protein DegV